MVAPHWPSWLLPVPWASSYKLRTSFSSCFGRNITHTHTTLNVLDKIHSNGEKNNCLYMAKKCDGILYIGFSFLGAYYFFDVDRQLYLGEYFAYKERLTILNTFLCCIYIELYLRPRLIVCFATSLNPRSSSSYIHMYITHTSLKLHNQISERPSKHPQSSISHMIDSRRRPQV